MNLDQALNEVLASEGGYTANPNDNGNWTGGRKGVGKLVGTNKGITAQALAKAKGVPVSSITAKDIKNITTAEAKSIYTNNYFTAPGIDKLPSDLQANVLDMAINAGPSRAISLLQEAAGVKADGKIGPDTIKAAQNVTNDQFAQARVDFYTNLATKNPTQATFLKGWVDRAKQYATDPQSVQAPDFLNNTVQTQQAMQQAGLNVQADGQWGPSSQAAWNMYTSGDIGIMNQPATSAAPAEQPSQASKSIGDQVANIFSDNAGTATALTGAAAFANPFLSPSKTRNAALQSLLSEESTPTSMNTSSIVGQAFGVDKAANDAIAIANNIANNGGTFNPNDTTDYTMQMQQDPIGTWNNFQDYGKTALGLASAMGLPSFLANAVEGAVTQNIANTFNDFINAYVGPLGGQTPDKTSLLEAAARGAVPFVDLTSEDAQSMINLMNQFGTTDAAVGYFSAGTDPALAGIVESMLSGADLAQLTPAEYGNVANLVANDYQSNIAKGMDRQASLDALNSKYVGSGSSTGAPAQGTDAAAPGFDLGMTDLPAMDIPTSNGVLTTPVAPQPSVPGTALPSIGGGGGIPSSASGGDIGEGINSGISSSDMEAIYAMPGLFTPSSSAPAPAPAPAPSSSGGGGGGGTGWGGESYGGSISGISGGYSGVW